MSIGHRDGPRGERICELMFNEDAIANQVSQITGVSIERVVEAMEGRNAFALFQDGLIQQVQKREQETRDKKTAPCV